MSSRVKTTIMIPSVFSGALEGYCVGSAGTRVVEKMFGSKAIHWQEASIRAKDEAHHVVVRGAGT